jgi:hypothetical protein
LSNTWNDVPDPRDGRDLTCDTCQEEAEERVCRHIGEKHACDSEADQNKRWDEWLTPSGLADRFRRVWRDICPDEERQTTVAEVSAIVEQEAKECLRVPLAVLYDEYPPPRGGKPSKEQEAWSLVLRSGALLVIQTRPAGGSLESCYFKKEVCREQALVARWRVLARILVSGYAERQADGSWKPKEMGSRGAATFVRVRFRSWTRWCLDGNHEAPWELIPDPYYPPAAPPLALGPRRPC